MDKTFLREVRETLSNAKPFASTQDSDVALSTRRWRFAVGVMLLAIFTLILSIPLLKENQWAWVGLACVTFLIGCWQLDRANRDLR